MSALPLAERLTRAELAALWRICPRTLARHEVAGIGPQPIRIGGRVLYRREDVVAWEDAQIEAAGD